MEIDSLLTGRRGVSLPFTDSCEPLLGNECLKLEMTEAVKRYGREHRWKSVEFRGGFDGLAGKGCGQAFVSHRIDLSMGEEATLAACKSSVRTAVRKAEHAGIEIEFAETESALETYYSLHCQTRQRHGLPPQPLSFFRSIARNVFGARQGFVAVARQSGRAVAGAVFFIFGERAIYKYGASDLQFQHLRPMNLLFWRTMQSLVSRGFVVLELGRSSSVNDGLRRFKLGWGALESSLSYLKYDLRKDLVVAEIDRAGGWHNAIFSALPPSLSRLCGELLYRHVS